MYQSIPYETNLEKLLTQLPKGIFLTVKAADEINTMVIGWGHIGYIWGKKVFIAYVRPSRYTYHLLEKAKEFTISIPLEDELKQEIAFCGQNSGRDINKIEICSLTLVNSRKINTPIIRECQLHYECKIIYKQPLYENLLNEEIKDKFYENGDFHLMYYGEIIDSYLYQM